MVAPGGTLDEEAQSPLQVGDVLVGKYRVERQIGRGGMGIVLAATHLQLEHLVAIKVLRRELLEDDKALHRLFAEARAAAKIRSEHVARVLDVGTLENGSPFIVMEYLEGEDLADLLDRQGALEVAQAVLFLLQSCEALAEVHAAEMVHRDLKPGNLFVAKLPDGSRSLKIVDFGISKHIGGSARNTAATTSAQVLGSPYYMPPEQMRAEPVDERSDIWSLGAILFEMLTGRPPFLGETLPEVYAAVLSGTVPSIESLRPGIPAALDDVVQRCLDKDPGQRFCDVADLAEALAPFGGPASAQSVESITRILTNPELFRARASAGPRLAANPEPEGSGTARGGIAIDPRLLITPGRVTPSRVTPSRLDPSRLDPSRITPSRMLDAGGGMNPLSPALVTPAMASQARRAPTASELGPLSATGALDAVEEPTSAPRRRALWAAAALLAVAAVAALLLRDGSDASEAASHPAAVALPPPGPAPLEPASAAPAETAAPPAGAAAAGSESQRLQTERHALEPVPSRAPIVSVNGLRAAVPSPHGPKPPSDRATDKKAKGKVAARVVASPAPRPAAFQNESGRPEPRPAAESPAPAPASGRANPSREEDPWNPSSFGGRK